MSIEGLNWALKQRGLTTSEKIVLLIIGNYADSYGKCFPSQAWIAELTEQSERTVRTAMTSLESRGLISRKARRRGNRATSDIIKLEMPGCEPANFAGSDLNRQLTQFEPDPIAGDPKEDTKEKDHDPTVSGDTPTVVEDAAEDPYSTTVGDPTVGFDPFTVDRRAITGKISANGTTHTNGHNSINGSRKIRGRKDTSDLRTWPKDFELDPEMIAFARGEGVPDPPGHFKAFRHHAWNHALASADWRATWRLWCICCGDGSGLFEQLVERTKR